LNDDGACLSFFPFSLKKKVFTSSLLELLLCPLKSFLCVDLLEQMGVVLCEQLESELVV
jgi:hypothetical protein